MVVVAAVVVVVVVVVKGTAIRVDESALYKTWHEVGRW